MTIRVCISCGTTSQRSGKSWELWNKCINCAKKCDPDYYRVKKCPDCGATSNNITAECWRKYNRCGKCAYKQQKKNSLTLCKECGQVSSKLYYQKNGLKPSLNLFYCVKCGCVVSPKGHRIIHVEGLIQ